MLLAGYILARLLRGYLMVLLALAALLWLLELLEILEDAPAGTYGLIVAAWQAGRTLPESLVDMLPVASVLATAWVIGMLNRDQELAVMRGFGISLKRIGMFALIPAVALGLAGLASLQWVTPALYTGMDRLVGTRLGDSGLWHGSHGLWIREQNEFLNVGELHLGRTPQRIRIYYFDEDGTLRQRVSAEQATILAPDEWRLETVRIEDFSPRDGRRVSVEAEYHWESFLTGDELERLLRSPASLPVTDLWRYVAGLKARGLDSDEFEMALWRRLVLPLASLAMALIAVVVAAPQRGRVMSVRVAAAIGVGLGYQLLAELVTLAGLALATPIIPVALAPALVLLVVAGWLLWRIDR